jgi:hypothetical protein
MTNRTSTHIKLASAAIGLLALASLTACGGGGSGSSVNSSVGSGGEVVVLAGNAITVPGVVSTAANLLKTVAWTITPQDPSSESVVLSNDTCTQVLKQDQAFVKPPGSTATYTRTGSSQWTCNLGVVAPQTVPVDRLYTLSLTGTDDLGNAHTTSQTLRVKPNPNPTTTFSQAAGQDFSVVSGANAPLTCTTSDTNANIQWAIVANGGKAVTLSSLTTAQSSFTAPVVTANTVITAQCRITSATGRVEVSNVNVTVTPPVAPTLVTNIASGGSVKPGSSINLTSTSNWVDATGANTTGPAITYAWSVGAGAPAGIQFLSPNNAATAMVVPGTITTPTYVPVTMTATAGATTSTSSVTVLVDPTSALNPSLSPAAQALKSGDIGKTKVTSGTTGTFYQWTVLSGPAVPLGGATTDTVEFVAPTVATATTMVIRVAIGYAPITASNPGLYFVDYVATVSP